MKTIIELYDERPIENVLCAEVFGTEQVVYICDAAVARDRQLHESLQKYFEARGVRAGIRFVSCDMTDTAEIAARIRETAEQYPDCALDIAGGTDAALFASGLVCAEKPLPVLTYSRKQNRFYNIRGAGFADQLENTMELNIRDCFLMAGGDIRQGRVDNQILDKYMGLFDGYFSLYLRYRKEWVGITEYIQRVSQPEKNGKPTLKVTGTREVKGARGNKLRANMGALQAMEKLGLLHSLKEKDDLISFTFRDLQVRTWLRDIGSVLELYVYKLCRDSGVYHDVRTSVVVDWKGEKIPDGVTNEIDVMATASIRPVFISCKTCDVKTEALNELAVLRDRFGSGIAKAAIVSTGGRGKTVMRNRAQELGIEVIELSDLQSGKAGETIRRLSRG